MTLRTIADLCIIWSQMTGLSASQCFRLLVMAGEEIEA